MKTKPSRGSLLHGKCLILNLLLMFATHLHVSAAEIPTWKVGIAEVRITPTNLFWMGGFASRTKPAEGVLDDLKVKVLALEAQDGGRAVLVTLDLVGIPKWLYDDLCSDLNAKHGLKRDQIRFAASHTHSGPVLKNALSDIYPLDDAQRKLIGEYSMWLEKEILSTIEKGLNSHTPATLWAGEGRATFAVNRRTNKETEAVEKIGKGIAPNGPSDFAVPVLAVKTPSGSLKCLVFGYAAHTSCLTDNYLWSADYAGIAQSSLEARYPGATAMFFQGCGSDQSALPRGTVARCRERGEDLAKAVGVALEKPLRQVSAKFRSAFEFIELDFGEQPSSSELSETGKGKDYPARWAKRLKASLDDGHSFQQSYPQYPVQVWKLGDDQLWIALGGEVCVDYALRFKKEFGSAIWVTGYANDVMAYIPSQRLWEEGGYQAGAFDVYGLPANKWCADIEDRIAGSVAKLVKKVR